MIQWYDSVRLDRLVILTGSEGGGDTTWNLPLTDNSLDTIILGPDFGESAGDIIAVDSNNGGTVTVNGQDYSGGEVAIGRSYTMSVELTQPYVRDSEGTPDIDAGLQIHQINLGYQNTGKLAIRTTLSDGRADRTAQIDVDPLQRRGRLRAWHNGDSELLRNFIENDSPKPSTVTSVEYAATYTPRMLMGIG